MFKEINAKDIKDNFIKTIADEWALISAGTKDKYNMMTASWGFMGEMWGYDCIAAVIRPQRYTKEFVDTRDTFTLSFYPAEKKDALSYLGKVSGRDEDKVKKVGFTPAFTNGNAYFEEAELVLVCRKMSRTPLRPEQFLDETVDGRWYPNKDYHEMYIAEVIDVLVKES